MPAGNRRSCRLKRILIKPILQSFDYYREEYDVSAYIDKGVH